MSEIRTVARHAGTVLAGQLAVMAFGVTDTVVAGRYASDALAALSVASAIFVSVYISLSRSPEMRQKANVKGMKRKAIVNASATVAQLIRPKPHSP